MAGRVILVATVLRAAVGFVVVRAAVVCERGVSAVVLTSSSLCLCARRGGQVIFYYGHWFLHSRLMYVRWHKLHHQTFGPSSPKHPFAPRSVQRARLHNID